MKKAKKQKSTTLILEFIQIFGKSLSRFVNIVTAMQRIVSSEPVNAVNADRKHAGNIEGTSRSKAATNQSWHDSTLKTSYDSMTLTS